MSFNAKNLSYEAKEPSFLRKLRDDYGGRVSSRHERPLFRPRKQRDGDDDDGPTYIDGESQNTISKADYETLMGHRTVLDTSVVNKEKRDNTDETRSEIAGDHDAREDENLRIKQKVAEIGTQRKRKAVKAIGDDFQDRTGVEKAPGPTKTEAKKKSYKNKKVKLSFNDDVEGEG